MTFDVAVIGLGATGSAATFHLARRGMRVIAIDQFKPGHDQGSSHGQSRIIRLGYFEHPSYVPLLRRAYALWRELELLSGQTLMTTTGIVEIGARDSELVSGTLASSELHNLVHEVLDAREIMRRFPAFALPDHFIGVFQPDGGFLAAQSAVQVHLKFAQTFGAILQIGQAVTRIETDGPHVRIHLGDNVVQARKIIVAAGPWLGALLPGLPVRVTRQVLAWFDPLRAELFQQSHFPIFMLESQHGIHYGFPLGADGEPGIKIAKHHHANETVDMSNVARGIGAEDEAMIRAGIAAYLPDANGPLLNAKTCLYTMTPDGDFLIDTMPDRPRIVVASPCSGHGFKFAPVLGEILADLADQGATSHDIGRFRLARF